MKTKTIKTISVAVFAHLLAISVVLAHAHAGDIVKQSLSDNVNHVSKVSTDVSAKAVSDLHNHIDKTSLKNVMKSAGDTATSTRRREANATLFEDQLSLSDKWIAQRMFWQAVFTFRA